MPITNRLYYYFLQFQRYALCIDLYAAESTGNWEIVRDCRLRISRLDTELATLQLNSEGV